MVQVPRASNLVSTAPSVKVKRRKYSLELWSDGAVSKNAKSSGVPSVGYSCIGEFKDTTTGETIHRIVKYGNMTGEGETSQRGELKGFSTGVSDIIPYYLQSYSLDEFSISCYSDSAYCMNCFNGVNGGKAWFPKWFTNGWQNSSGKPIENVDIWTDIFSNIFNTTFLAAKQRVFADSLPDTARLARQILNDSKGKPEILLFQHVPGHAGILLNELADHYAVTAKAMQPNCAEWELLIN